MKKFGKLFILLISILLCCTVLFVGCEQKEESITETFTPQEEVIYEILIEKSYDFKDPTSVRIISGTLIYSNPENGADLGETKGSYLRYSLGLFRIMATNSFGVKITESFMVKVELGEVTTFLGMESYLDEIEDLLSPFYLKLFLAAIDDAKEVDPDINYEAINIALAQYWENY